MGIPGVRHCLYEQGAMVKRLGRACARLRRHIGNGVPETTFSAVRSETATTVAVPWRSSTSWDEYDLRVYPRRDPDRFQFYAEMGNAISVRVEASLPGPSGLGRAV